MRRSTGPTLTALMLALFAGSLQADVRFPGSDPLAFASSSPSLATAVQTVTALATGPDGYLWIGSPFGLVRWDGHEAERFVAGDAGLTDDEITALHRDREGELFVGTRHGGLLRFDAVAGSFERVPGPGPGDGAVTAIAHDSRNRLQVGTSASGVYTIEPERTAFTVVSHDPLRPVSLGSPEVTALAVDAADRVYVATTDRGLTVLAPDLSRATVHRRMLGNATGLPSDAITALVVDAAGDLWVGTATGALGRYDPAEDRWIPTLPLQSASVPAPIRTLFEDSERTLWVGRDGAPTLRLGSDRLPITVQCADHAAVFHEDSAGVVRAGTHAGGVRRHLLHGEQFARYGARGCGGTAGEVVWSLREANSRIVVARSPGGAVVLDPVTGVSRAIPGARGLPAGFGMVVRVEPVAGGFWYLSSVGNAVLLDDAGTVLRALSPGRYALSVGRSGDDVWIGTARSGVITFTPDGATRAYPTDAPVYALVPDPSGGVWLGADGELLYLDPRTGSVERFPTAPAARPSAPGGDRVFSIEPRSDGLVWVAAREGGVLLMDRQGVIRRRLEPRVDFEADLAYAVAGDGHGGLWFTTNRGLFRLDERRGILESYGRPDGVPADEFNAGALLRGSDGTLWAGTVNGALRFDPVTVTPVTEDPVVTISRAALLPGRAPTRAHTPVGEVDSPVVADEYVVPSGSHGLAIHAAVSGVVDPSAARFEHQLIDEAGSAVRSGSGRVFELAGLEPGAYRLVVEVSSGGASGRRGELVGRITVLPEFRETPWMPVTLVVVGLLVVALARAVWRSKVAGYERRLEAARRQHARDVAERRAPASPVDEVAPVREPRAEADGNDRPTSFE